MRIRTKNTNEFLDLSSGGYYIINGELVITLDSGTELTIGQQDVFTIRQKFSPNTRRIFSEEELITGLDAIWGKKKMMPDAFKSEDNIINFKYYTQQAQKQLLQMINHKFVRDNNMSDICICGYKYSHLLHANYRDVEGQ